MHQVAAFIHAHGYPAVFALLMLGIVGLPLPDEWILIFAGYLVFKGQFHVVPAFLAALLGSACGITFSYLLGGTLGFPFVRKYGRWFRFDEEGTERVNAWFERAGRWSLLIGYFIPGVRHLAGFAAGTSRLRFPVFALFAYAGAFAWSSSFMALGYFFGKEWTQTGRPAHRGIVIGTVLAAILALGLVLYRGTRRPRRSRNDIK